VSFLLTTIEALRDKLAELESQREQHKADLDYHAEHVAKCQAKYDGLSAAISDYVSLLRHAEQGEKHTRPFRIDDRVIVNEPKGLNHDTYGFISETNPNGELLIEFDRDGTIHSYETSQLVHEDDEL